MTTEPSSNKEFSNTYFVQDQSNNELKRLAMQDHIITQGMGGILPEQPDPTRFHRVIDIACGSGGWLIEAAKTYPTMTFLVGVDVNRKLIEYARSQAKEQGVSDRVEFHVTDATLMIEFPERQFDLVNQRFGWSFLRTWDWPKQLLEYQRVTRSGGIIRISEAGVFGKSNSPALTQLAGAGREAFNRAGHTFKPGPTGVTDELPHLLQRFGLLNVQTRPVTLTFHSGSDFCEDVKILFRTITPFLQKWGTMPKDYSALYQKAVQEIDQPDFSVNFDIVTAWGTRK